MSDCTTSQIVSGVSADILDEAIDTVCDIYSADLQRQPSKFELLDLIEQVLAERFELLEPDDTTANQ